MIANFSSIKFFFFLFFLIPLNLKSLDYPKPRAKPEIKLSEFQDVFEQIKRQNWVMAIAIADDYNNKSLSSYIRWLDITRPGSNHDFFYLTNFYKNHKHWPNSEKIIEKIESSITENTDKKKVLKWFENYKPITSKGSIDYLEFRLRNNQNFDKVSTIKNIWINKNLTRNQQRSFIKKYGKFWSQNDNWKRFNRLIYEGKNISARRTLNRISGELRKLGEARLALSRRSPNVAKLIRNVPDRLQKDPGLIYERMRWRRKAKLDTAADLLFDPPEKIENPRNWWINSRIVVRRLLNKKKYNDAYRILKNHNLPLAEDSGQEAEWLAGWVSIFHMRNPTQSINHFKNVFENSDNQHIKAKAAFWLSKAYHKIGKKDLERLWLEKSAKDKYSFYGQNSSIKIGSFEITNDGKAIKKQNGYDDLFGVIEIIRKSNQPSEKALVFFNKLMELSLSNENKLYVLEIASQLDNKYLVTNLSRKIKEPSLKYSYPLIENYIPVKYKNSSSTMALIHAITHQESNFRINAYSSAGARGLMQLMPFTAKKVAKNLKIRYHKKALTTNPQYNIILGTTYINQMLDRFDNALPLALAAYNAGPGRVKIWLKRYGDPRSNEIDYIDWIESIPISETRYYVKKVLSNLRIYQKKYGLTLYEVRKF
ncbi:MAG: hypothetical protein CMM95_01020 [Rickettsiales bacterium]|nr:hypothetical protein [Rickettsiales bacterium]